MPTIVFSGTYFWFVFSLIVLAIAFYLFRKEMKNYTNHPYYPVVSKWYKWVFAVGVVVILFGNFQVTQQPTATTIRGFDNTTPVVTTTVNEPKTKVDVKGDYNRSLEQARKELSE